MSYRVSIQGYLGSFHHIVATHLFQPLPDLLERSAFKEVFADVVSGKAELGLVAIENTIAGSVTETLDLFLTQPVKVVGEAMLHIHQNLLVIPGTKLEELKTVYSHPVALQQCLEFFARYPDITLVATDDTGKSVERMIQKGEKTAGSIASTLAGELYHAETLQAHIETNSENYTRFLLITAATTTEIPDFIHSKQTQLKTSVILQVAHKPGSLAACLQHLASNNCNLTRIESRPLLGKPWEYAIYLDLTSELTPAQVVTVLEELHPFATQVKVLGTYPIGETFES